MTFMPSALRSRSVVKGSVPCSPPKGEKLETIGLYPKASMHVDLAEVLRAGLPDTHAHRGGALHGLIDGDRGVVADRPDGLVERPGHGIRRCVLVATGAGVGGDGAWAVAFDDGGHALGDLVEGLGGAGSRRSGRRACA